MKILLSVLVCFILSACAGTITTSPEFTDEELHAEQELQRQMSVDDRIEKSEKQLKKDLEMQQRLGKVAFAIFRGGKDICGKISYDPSLCLYDIEITRKKTLNAFTDGQTITFHSSMINFLKTDDELAAIMGHEYAHSLLKHIDTTKVNALIGALIGTAADIALGGSGNTLGRVGAHYGARAHSPKRENEADYVGIYVMANAGYDITKAPNVWRRLAIKHPSEIYNKSTHPTSAERFLKLDKAVKEIQAKQARGEALIPNIKLPKKRAKRAKGVYPG